MKKILILAIVLLSLTTSCSEDPIPSPDEEKLEYYSSFETNEIKEIKLEITRITGYTATLVPYHEKPNSKFDYNQMEIHLNPLKYPNAKLWVLINKGVTYASYKGIYFYLSY